MAQIEGFGKCGICLDQIETPTPPLRHLKGLQMAHKTCYDKQVEYEKSDEYRIDQAKSAVDTAERKLGVAKYDLEVAQLKLKQLLASVQLG